MPWLALDIGNSALKGGLFEGGRLAGVFREEHAEAAGGDPAWLEAVRRAAPERIGIASVVPERTERVAGILRRALGVEPERVSAALRLPFRLGYRTPETLGADRLAAAAAGYVRYGRTEAGPRSVIVVSAGTAVAYEVVDAEGVYRGGAIGAGPVLVHRALAAGTAQLPELPPAAPERPIGRSTAEAMHAGVMFGFLDGVSGMLARLGASLPGPRVVVATGGWGEFLAAQLPAIDLAEPHLVLHGVRELMALNPPA